MDDDDLIPPDAPSCPHCDSPVMIPWKTWWECPRCDRTMVGPPVSGTD